jgi:hypothetical protein
MIRLLVVERMRQEVVKIGLVEGEMVVMVGVEEEKGDEQQLSEILTVLLISQKSQKS